MFFIIFLHLGMWNSREMMKNVTDQQLFVKITLRELIIYCGFMFILCYGKYLTHQIIDCIRILEELRL